MSGPQGPIEPASAAAAPDRPARPRSATSTCARRHRPRPRRSTSTCSGFDVVHEARDVPGWGTTGDVLFVSAGGYHHHLGFNTWKSAGRPAAARRRHGPAPRRALLLVARPNWREIVARLLDAGVHPPGATDHGTHLAVYVTDPDGNDLELAWDRPPQEWPAYDNAEFIDASMDIDNLVSLA